MSLLVCSSRATRFFSWCFQSSDATTMRANCLLLLGAECCEQVKYCCYVPTYLSMYVHARKYIPTVWYMMIPYLLCCFLLRHAFKHPHKTRIHFQFETRIVEKAFLRATKFLASQDCFFKGSNRTVRTCTQYKQGIGILLSKRKQLILKVFNSNDREKKSSRG